MRSIPFRVVCLLGMNEGEYPRQTTPNSFDLMQYHHQKGIVLNVMTIVIYSLKRWYLHKITFISAMLGIQLLMTPPKNLPYWLISLLIILQKILFQMKSHHSRIPMSIGETN